MNNWKEGQNPKYRHYEAAENCALAITYEMEDEWIETMSVTTLTNSGLSNFSGFTGASGGWCNISQAGDTQLSDVATSSINTSLIANRHILNNQRQHRTPSPPPPCYLELEERKNSFLYINWPSHLTAQPHNLAKAGFYYIGPGDRVKCGFCGGKLKQWLREDNPIEEHVKHFPECTFVKVVEQQTASLAQNIRSEDQKANCVCSEQLIRERENKNEPEIYRVKI